MWRLTEIFKIRLFGSIVGILFTIIVFGLLPPLTAKIIFTSIIFVAFIVIIILRFQIKKINGEIAILDKMIAELEKMIEEGE